MPTLSLTHTLTAGATENINHVQTNFEDIVDVVNALDGDNLADGAVSTVAKLAAAVQAFLVPTGSLLPYTGTSAPTGFLLCDGSAVSRTTYADLFAIAGTAYGTGDGSTTFNLPDLRGRVVVGKRSTLSMGENDGLAEASRSPNHTHTFSGTTSVESSQDAGGSAGVVANNNHTHTFSGTTATGGPSFQVTQYIVKT